jgi:NAD(P)-dependent dehydrogenase (short-subunit alcohol dehydrogenase family)
MAELEGKIALVTGGSKGIGAAAAKELAAHGVSVMIAARGLAAAERVRDEIRAAGGTAEAVACDISDYARTEAAVETTCAALGGLDILVNNAAIIEPISRLDEMDPNDWVRGNAINYTGAFFAVRAVLPHFMARKQGVIINVSSGAAVAPLEGWGAYCSAKAGLAMLTRQIDVECKDHGIRVFGFQPGMNDTEMQVKIRASGVGPLAKVPREDLRRPKDTAKVFVYLCTEGAADLAGGEISINDESLRRRAGLE